ncbi:ABC transporter permease [Haloferula sp. BvORR071]|uniref:ABC transporter permease n=1 Tax=Haloferula sp. BvORR071 TaxID=1396141 RepID=UPI000556FBA5|nr:ABC transporter permease [Haloferula sp. BvORR071]
MSAWLAIFRAEFRRALPLLPWVALAQVLMFCVRSGVGPVISDRLAFWIEWGTWLLAALILVPSVWSDSPSREARFIATRPIRSLSFHSAKLAGLLVLIAFPFVAVEFASLVAAGMSARVVVLGTLQIALFGLVVVVASFPILWLWRGRIAAVVGVLAIPVTMLWFLPYLLRHQSRLSDLSWGRSVPLLYAPVMMLALAAIAILLGCLLLYRGRFRRTVVTLLYLPLCCAGAAFAVWCATRPLALVNPQPAVLVSVDLNTSGGDPKPWDQLSVLPPAPAVDRQLEVERSFSRLVVNQRDLSPWDLPMLGSQGSVSLNSLPLQQALRAHYGSRIQLPANQFAGNPGASTSQSFDRDASGALSFDLAVRETVIRWDVIGDLPLVAGASLRQGDLRWSLKGRQGPGGSGDIRSELTLCHQYPALWLDSPKAPILPTFQFFCILPSGRVMAIQNYWPITESGSRSTLRERRLTLHRPSIHETVMRADGAGAEYEPPEIPAMAMDWPEGSRLVILQPVPLSQTDYTWKSPAPVPAPVPPLSKRKPDPRAGTVMEWLKTHPAPAQPSSAEEVSAWLAEFLPRIGEVSSQSPDYRTLFNSVGGLVAAHPDQVHDAPRRNAYVFDPADEILDSALESFLSRDAVQRFPKLGEDPKVLRIYVEKGWGGDIIAHAAKRIRLGMSLDLAELLFANPSAVDFSEAEWLALFRLKPSPEGYRALRGNLIPGPMLDEETDRIIDRNFSLSDETYYTELNSLLELALLRGREEGPRWLQEWARDWKKRPVFVLRGKETPESIFTDSVRKYLRQNFELPPAAASGAPYDWFLAQDPAAFRFNPETRKYQIP